MRTDFSSQMHVLVRDYLDATDKSESCLCRHVRGFGLIFLEVATLIVDLAQLAFEILTMVLGPIARGVVHLMSLCCKAKMKNWKTKLNELHEGATPLATAKKTAQMIGALTLSPLLAWSCPCLNYEWHHLLGLTHKQTNSATIPLE